MTWSKESLYNKRCSNFVPGRSNGVASLPDNSNLEDLAEGRSSISVAVCSLPRMEAQRHPPKLDEALIVIFSYYALQYK